MHMYTVHVHMETWLNSGRTVKEHVLKTRSISQEETMRRGGVSC